MAWSSFAHLPTTEKEYYYILSNLKTGMSTRDVDAVIATYKGKDKVQHHYRSNLARIGVFEIKKDGIILNYDEKKLCKNKKLLKKILYKSLIESNAPEINDVIDAVEIKGSYDLKAVIGVLEKKYPLIDYSSFCRWIRPIVALLKIIDVLALKFDKEYSYVRFLQEAYLKLTKDYNHSISLELVELELKKIDDSFEVISILDSILEMMNIRFKIELLMLPSWATKNKTYKIGKDSYTHIKVKSNLLKED